MSARQAAAFSNLRAVLLAAGWHGRPDRTPYIWRDPAASGRRLAMARAILAEVGNEPDVWDLPPSAPDATGLGRGRRAAYHLKGCGTDAAYRRHLRHGEKPCDECTDANRRRQHMRRAS